ncbi:MAG: hypothetical protein WBD63_09325 [Phycisphaerae bacterium]|nr:hypothetical protein [Phycisphaerae bacterium]
MNGARPTHEPTGGAASPWRTAAYIAVLAILLAAVIHPLRRHVEDLRQDLLGRRESPAWRLVQASQFGLASAAGNSVRMVPGGPRLELGDLASQATILVLGGFRGPYAVWLWMQAEEEKHQNAHFDLIDRYTRIAALQSEYPQMWAYHGWNLAWNISAQWHSLDRKYQWIRRATEFLQEGNRKNPHNAEIMAALGRIYGEKLGRSQEAEYYRARVREDEGRSTFLIAYEWYDRARQTNDRYGTLGGSLSKAVIYSQACHNLSYYATELTAEAFTTLKKSLEPRQAGDDTAARDAFQRGLAELNDALGAWEWARREWKEHAIRFEREGVTAELANTYQRFYGEADATVRQLEQLRSQLTYESLPSLAPDLDPPELDF